MKSPMPAMFLDSFKAAAAEGAVLELQLRLLAAELGLEIGCGLLESFRRG